MWRIILNTRIHLNWIDILYIRVWLDRLHFALLSNTSWHTPYWFCHVAGNRNMSNSNKLMCYEICQIRTNWSVIYLCFSRSVDELCELTAELFAITYTRNKPVQISLRFVYGGVVPWNDKFTRKLGLILYFTESYFDRIARISAHLKVFRKIPPVKFLPL